MGIAEDQAALFAGGLATEGFKPFLAIYSTFMQRAYDMLIHDISLQNLHRCRALHGWEAGLSGNDGPTHHGLFDMGCHSGTYQTWCTCSQRTKKSSPTCSPDDRQIITRAYIAIQYPRSAGTGAKPKPQPNLLEIGKAGSRPTRGREVAMIGLGNMFALAEGNCESPRSRRRFCSVDQSAMDQTDGCRHPRVLCTQC